MIQSHVGQIISTTLNTEDKVKELYGGVKWTRVDGFLKGVSSGAGGTGGSSSESIPNNSHTISITAPTVNSSNNSGNCYYQPRVISVSASTSSTGSASITIDPTAL